MPFLCILNIFINIRLLTNLTNMEQGQHLLNNDLQVDSFAQLHLKETAMWAKLLGIVGFVMSSLVGVFLFCCYCF
jgi:hypothetical protein